MICTFIGNRDTPPEVEKPLEEAILRLIEKGVTTFYVGHHGKFDWMAHRVLHRLMETTHPEIACVVVLAYMNMDVRGWGETMVPEGLEKVPPKFGIDHRNRYMLKCADYVITYVRFTFRGAGNYAEIAQKMEEKGEITVIPLYSCINEG